MISFTVSISNCFHPEIFVCSPPLSFLSIEDDHPADKNIYNVFLFSLFPYQKKPKKKSNHVQHSKPVSINCASFCESTRATHALHTYQIKLVKYRVLAVMMTVKVPRKTRVVKKPAGQRVSVDGSLRYV